MADKKDTIAINQVGSGANEEIDRKWHDNGDGTYSEVLTVISQSLSPATVDGAITGQITVTTAGTAVPGPDVDLPNGAYIRALAGNAGLGYVGNDGSDDITSGNGYELSPGDAVPCQVANLSDLRFDAANDGDKFCWMKA